MITIERATNQQIIIDNYESYFSSRLWVGFILSEGVGLNILAAG